MRVLHVDAGREWRGGQNQVRLLLRELSREPGIDVRLVTRRGSQLAERVLAAGGFVHGVPWTAALDLRAWWFLRRFIWSFRPDIVHVHDGHGLSVTRAALWDMTRPAGIPAFLLDPLTRWRRKQTAPWQDEDWNTPLLIGHRRVDFHVRRGSSWRRVPRIVAVSEAVKRVLVEDGIDRRDVTVIVDGVDPDEIRTNATQLLNIRARLGLPPQTPLAVNVAALVDHKDHLTLIRAAAEARQPSPELHWAIAGEGKCRHVLEAEIARLGLGDRVHLLGYTPAADALINEADVFVMSSKEEGLGSVILNALALGKPVVATAAGGIPEILAPAALVPIGDAAALARRVVATLRSPAPTSLPDRFTAKSMAQATLALYRSLV